MKTIDIKFYELCNEIDYWKNQAKYWEAEYNEKNKKYRELIDYSINHSYTMIGKTIEKLLLDSDKYTKIGKEE